MSLINKTAKKLNLLLLSTLIISPEIKSYTAEQNNNDMKPALSIQPITSEDINFVLELYNHTFKNGIDICNSPNTILEGKKLWVAQAFGNLKELTDLTHLIKSTHKLTLSAYKDSVPSICGWSDKLKLFNMNEFYFHLSTDKISRRLIFSDINGDNINGIIKLLLIKLTKKSTYLESYVKTTEKVVVPKKELSQERNTIIWELYRSRYNIITNKKRINETIVNGISINCGNVYLGNFKNIKLPYVHTEIDTTKKYLEIESKMEESWKAYTSGLDFMKKDPQNKIAIMNALAHKTLPDVMEDIKTDDIIELSSYLSHKNRTLLDIYNTVLIISQNVTQEIQKKKAFFNIEVTSTGRRLINNLSLNSLESKKNWILDACSLLKTFEDEINSNLFGNFFTPKANVYSFWNVSRGIFHQDENLPLGIPSLSGQIIYLSLNQFTETYINRVLIPTLLNQIIRKNQECILWKTKENHPFDLSQLPKITDPQERFFKIYELSQNNSKLKEQTEDYLDEYIKIKNIPIYTAHVNYQVSIHLEKVPQGPLASMTKLIQSACEYAQSFNHLLSEIKLNNRDIPQKENIPILAKLYEDFIAPILKENTDDNILTAIKFLSYQNEMISQLNQTLISGLESEIKSSVPHNISTVNMTQKEKLLHKLEQRKRGNNTVPNKPKAENENPKEIIPIPNKPDHLSSKQPKAISKANPKKKKYKNTDSNLGKKTHPKPETSTLQSASHSIKSDSIKLVNLKGGKLGVVAPETPYIQERKPAPEISEPKKVMTPPQQNRPQPIRSKKPIARHKPAHQNQPPKPEKTTWSDVVEGIAPITINIPSSEPMAIITKSVETPSVSQQIPQVPSENTEAVSVQAGSEPKQEAMPPVVFDNKEIVPALKNNTTIYNVDETKRLPEFAPIPQSFESSPRTVASAPVIYNYSFPANNYTPNGLYVPHTLTPPKDAKSVVIQIALSEDDSYNNDMHNQKRKNKKEIKVVTHVYHHYPQEVNHLKEEETEKKRPELQRHEVSDNSSENKTGLPHNPLVKRRRTF